MHDFDKSSPICKEKDWVPLHMSCETRIVSAREIAPADLFVERLGECFQMAGEKPWACEWNKHAYRDMMLRSRTVRIHFPKTHQMWQPTTVNMEPSEEMKEEFRAMETSLDRAGELVTTERFEAYLGGSMLPLRYRVCAGRALRGRAATKYLMQSSRGEQNDEVIREQVRKLVNGELDDEVCPIDGECAPDTVTCCGHAFDFDALSHWASIQAEIKCPVC